MKESSFMLYWSVREPTSIKYVVLEDSRTLICGAGGFASTSTFICGAGGFAGPTPPVAGTGKAPRTATCLARYFVLRLSGQNQFFLHFSVHSKFANFFSTTKGHQSCGLFLQVWVYVVKPSVDPICCELSRGSKFC
jgi:hypothetical protein